MAPPQDPIASLRAALRGHYEFERELGQGAFATVYLARDLKHDRKVAIKVLNADPNSETGEIRFIREIRVLARLQHPNILPLHDSGHVEALLYYVMPFVKGETLRSRMERQRQLLIEDAGCIAQEAADALSYAHAQGIIHRDIKPENILLSEKHAIVADFGIARAIDLAGIRQLTRTGGGSPGTPAYMAPEQLLGEGEVDVRCDVYSLGCVLYEMLTGKHPFAGKDGFVKRFTESPPTPSSIRATIPRWLDDVCVMSLARDPAERYQSAADLTKALTLGLARERATPPGVALTQPTAVRADGRNAAAVFVGKKNSNSSAALPTDVGTASEHTTTREWWKHPASIALAVAAAVTLIGVAIASPDVYSHRFGPSSLDSTRFVVVPLAASDSKEAAVSSRAADKLYDALSSWEGLNLVPDLKVNEVLGGSDRTVTSLGEAMNVARKLGAGQLVWGRPVRSADTLVTRAELYDLRRPNNTVREAVVMGDDATAYARAAAALLAPKNRPQSAAAGDALTHSYPAWIAYNLGHIALAQWNLVAADSQFTRAVAVDQDFAAAHLWLGQLREWRSPTNPTTWRELADRAARSAATLATRDSLLALALSAMATGQYPSACHDYQALTTRDGNDVIAWYGLGECQALDRAVLPDPASPSGWRWRSSYESAVDAFVHALRVDPRAHALLSFPRLRRLLPTTAVTPRTDDSNNPNFAAFPSLEADTLGFVPFPISVFRSGLPTSATQSLDRALSRNLSVLFGVVNEWLTATPDNPDAYEALADLLETRGDISTRGNIRESAPLATRKAYALSSDPVQRLRLAVRLARLQFKRGDYAAVRKATDSLIAANVDGDYSDPPVLISLSALTGKTEVTAREATRRIIPENLDGIALGAGLRNVAGRLFTYAALGVCERLTALRSQLELELSSSIADDQREKIRDALLARPGMMMVACGQTPPPRAGVPVSTLALLEDAFAKNDRVAVKKVFATIERVRRVYRPGDVPIDRTYIEAWIRRAVGDTTGAEHQLDESLNAIPNMSAAALQEVGAAASVGRAMALRAEIAAARGDAIAAKKWAHAVLQLWQDADPPLAPVLDRMRSIAHSTP